MIDGIKIQTEITDIGLWKNLTNINLINRVSRDSGEIVSKKRDGKIITVYEGKWETFKIEVKEIKNEISQKIKYYLTLRGSLHKNQFNGKNYEPFYINNLFNQINHLSKSLHINPDQTRISNIEIGLNLLTSFNVDQFIKNRIINYKCKMFNTYEADRSGLELGLYWDLSQYKVKLYDKGLQNNLDINLLRLEKKYKKMQYLNKMNISFLSDLLNKEKVYKLKFILIDCWSQILVSEIDDIDSISTISKSEKELVSKGSNPKFWQKELSKDRDHYNYLRKKFKKINNFYGEHLHAEVEKLIHKSWEVLFRDSTKLPTVYGPKFHKFTIKIMGNNMESLTY